MKNKTSLRLAPDHKLTELPEDIHLYDQIIIDAKDFTDGRIYSLALQLRQSLKFKGQLIAENPLEDNWPYLRECGFSSMHLSTDLM